MAPHSNMNTRKPMAKTRCAACSMGHGQNGLCKAAPAPHSPKLAVRLALCLALHLVLNAALMHAQWPNTRATPLPP